MSVRRQPAASRLDLVGRDLATRGDRSLGRRWRVSPALLAGIILAALAIAALRVDLIRLRYGLAEALREEKTLLEERRASLAALRALRDPTRLSRLAADYGLARPEKIVELPQVSAPAPELEAAP